MQTQNYNYLQKIDISPARSQKIFDEMASSHKGLLTERHLFRLFGAEGSPRRAEELAIKLLSANEPKNFDRWLSSLPSREFESDTKYSWKIITSSRRNIPLVEARKFDGSIVDGTANENIGKDNEPFYLIFPEDYFAAGEVIQGDYEMYQIRIMEEGLSEGTNTVYKVQLWSGAEYGMPAEYLMRNSRFTPGTAPIEKERSREQGTARIAGTQSMENYFTRIRSKYELSPGTVRTMMMFYCPSRIESNPSNNREGLSMKTNVGILDSILYNVEKQWSDYKSYAMQYLRSNERTDGTFNIYGFSGEVIKAGACFTELIEKGNVIHYSSTENILDIIRDNAMLMVAGKTDPKDRKFIIQTGTFGAAKFSQEAWGKLNPVLTASSNMPSPLSQITSEINGANSLLAKQYQITKYSDISGLEFEVVILPEMDDNVRNTITDPMLGPGPAKSYEYRILYAGEVETASGQKIANIQKATIKGEGEYRGAQNGPFSQWATGHQNNMNAATDEDISKMHMIASFGCIVYDPSRCLVLKPTVLSGRV